MESVVDFGHAKQIFEDADVFPSILVARKPTAGPPPATARVCAIPREQLRIDDLSRQIEAEGFEMPRDKLAADAWTLEPPGVMALMEKIRRVGVPLKEFAGSRPLSRSQTGLNEAFLIDTPTKERIVRADPQSAAIIKPYLARPGHSTVGAGMGWAVDDLLPREAINIDRSTRRSSGT